jgi:hypothetical protein
MSANIGVSRLFRQADLLLPSLSIFNFARSDRSHESRFDVKD